MICSTSVDPVRGMPTMKTIGPTGSVGRGAFPSHAFVHTSINSSNRRRYASRSNGTASSSLARAATRMTCSYSLRRSYALASAKRASRRRGPGSCPAVSTCSPRRAASSSSPFRTSTRR
jgi:hypothetical protein